MAPPGLSRWPKDAQRASFPWTSSRFLVFCILVFDSFMGWFSIRSFPSSSDGSPEPRDAQPGSQITEFLFSHVHLRTIRYWQRFLRRDNIMHSWQSHQSGGPRPQLGTTASSRLRLIQSIETITSFRLSNFLSHGSEQFL